jgi:hypothetical protein
LFANHFLFLGIGIYRAVVVIAAPVVYYLHVAQWYVCAVLGVQVLAYLLCARRIDYQPQPVGKCLNMVVTVAVFLVAAAFQLPKPMFVFAFEGELFAFIVNGDRFVLLALLPRRKPRTDGSVQLPYHSVIELNLTT